MGIEIPPGFVEVSPGVYEKRKAGNQKPRPRPVIQERKDDDARQADNRPQKTKVDGEGGNLHGVTITLLISDKRDRDADGAITTILDTYLFALGRLLEMDRSSLRKLAKSEERRRRGRD